MSEDRLKDLFDGIRARFQVELDEQFTALRAEQAHAAAELRQEIEADLEARWTARLDAAATEWTARLEAERRAADERRRESVAEVEREWTAKLDAAATEWTARLEEERRAADERRRESVADVEREWSARLDALGADWTAQLESERAAAEERRRGHVAGIEKEWAARLEALGAEWAVRLESERTAAEEQRRGQVAELEREWAARLELDRAAAEERRRGQVAELEREWAARLEAARTEWGARLEAERAAADARHRQNEADIELRWAAKLEALRAEWMDRLQSERNAADIEAASRALAERERLTAELDAERHARQLLAAQLERARSTLVDPLEVDPRKVADTPRQQRSTPSDAQMAERQAQLEGVDRLLGAVRRIGAAPSLSETLAALHASVAAEVPRAAVFVVNGSRLQQWKTTGFDVHEDHLQMEVSDGTVLGEAIARLAPTHTSAVPAPGFASLRADRVGLAVPVVVGGAAVAVLYADDGTVEPHASPAPWPEIVELLALHASEHLAHLTAMRTAEVMRQSAAATRGAPAAARPDAASAARRYARLLVSEIKLYNEPAVRQGRENRDLLDRLGTEISRARQLYEQRVPPTLSARHQYFDHELLQTLAGGDATLLGARA